MLGELRGAVELSTVALLVMVLPWPLTFRGLRWLTRFSLFQGGGQQEAATTMIRWWGPRAITFACWP